MAEREVKETLLLKYFWFRTSVMGVIQDTDTITYLFLHQLPHTFGKTGVTMGVMMCSSTSFNVIPCILCSAV